MTQGLSPQGTLPQARRLCESAQATQAEVNTRVYWKGILDITLRKIQKALSGVKGLLK